jgi:hypothetical protein
MAQTHTLTWHGDAVLAQLREAMAKGITKGAEHLLGEANALVPHQEGTLERSGTATPADPDGLTATVTFDTPYAVTQHEDMTAQHDEGRQAKYLEQPANSEQDTMQALIAAEVRRAVRG